MKNKSLKEPHKNLLENLTEVRDKSTKEIIHDQLDIQLGYLTKDDQLDIQLGYLTRDELDTSEIAFNNRRVTNLEEMHFVLQQTRNLIPYFFDYATLYIHWHTMARETWVQYQRLKNGT